MLYHSSGSAASSRRVRRTLTLTPDVSRPEHSDVNKFALHRQICQTVLDGVLKGASLDEQIDFSVDIRLAADVPRRKAAVQATVRVDVSFDPIEFGADPARAVEMSPDDGLRRIIENEVDRVWDAFCLGQFVEDVRTVASCLHVLTRWNGSSAAELLGALQRLEPVVLRHGHDLDDVVDLRKLRMPMTGELPDALRKEGVLLVDRSGYMLLIDQRGRLQVTRLSFEDFDSWQHVGAAKTGASRELAHA
jgi:hypothetical protein